MKSIRVMIRESLAAKISFLVGAVMVVLIGAMSAYLVYSQIKEQKATMEEFLLAKARLAANIGAESYGTVLESAIDHGTLRVDDIFDTNYQPIEGYNFKNKKYHTRYDSYTDNMVLGFQEEIQKDPDFVFSIGVDLNGYLPTHNVKYQKRITGDPKKDLAGNRSKRIFDDPTGIQAAKNTKQGFVQVYKRDTGATMWDVSSPIYVKGRQWGGFRIGVSMGKIEAQLAAQLKFLLGFSGALVLFVVLFVFFSLQRAMRPIRQLTELADQISAGEALDATVRVDRVDEVGRLSRSLDRLRVSMKAAIERLEV